VPLHAIARSALLLNLSSEIYRFVTKNLIISPLIVILDGFSTRLKCNLFFLFIRYIFYHFLFSLGKKKSPNDRNVQLSTRRIMFTVKILRVIFFWFLTESPGISCTGCRNTYVYTMLHTAGYRTRYLGDIFRIGVRSFKAVFCISFSPALGWIRWRTVPGFHFSRPVYEFVQLTHKRFGEVNDSHALTVRHRPLTRKQAIPFKSTTQQ